MRVLGVDPGLTGAIGIIDSTTGNAAVFDAPTTETIKAGKRRTVYLPEIMLSLLLDLGPINFAVIEHQQPMGIEGVTSACSIGYGYGLWIMALASLGISREIVRPADWKRQMLLGRDKNDARCRAMELFPFLASSLSRKKDHGRAEALLLAEYGRRFTGKQGEELLEV